MLQVPIHSPTTLGCAWAGAWAVNRPEAAAAVTMIKTKTNARQDCMIRPPINGPPPWAKSGECNLRNFVVVARLNGVAQLRCLRVAIGALEPVGLLFVEGGFARRHPFERDDIFAGGSAIALVVGR